MYMHHFSMGSFSFIATFRRHYDFYKHKYKSIKISNMRISMTTRDLFQATSENGLVVPSLV